MVRLHRHTCAKERVAEGLVTFQRIPKHLLGKGKGQALLKWQLKFLRRTNEPKRCSCHAFLPSEYLDLEISDDQKKLMNPTQRDFTIREIMKDAGGLGAVKRMAKRKMDAYGFVQSECYEVTDDRRVKSQRAALQLAASMAEVSNAEKAEQAAKQVADDDELLGTELATKSLAKLRKNNMDWVKLTRKEIRCLALKYLNTRIDKGAKKAEVVTEIEQAYEHAQPNVRDQFDEAYNASNVTNDNNNGGN